MNQITNTEANAVEQATPEVPQPKPPTPTLIHTLLHAINEHIDTQVNEKVSAVLEAHSAVKYIDESFREAIGDIAGEVIAEHTNDNDHIDEDRVKEIMEDSIIERIRREVRDIDISDQVHDVITDYDFDDKMDSYDFDDKIEQYLANNDFIDNDTAIDLITETVEEMLDKKLKEVLKKLLEKLDGI